MLSCSSTICGERFNGASRSAIHGENTLSRDFKTAMFAWASFQVLLQHLRGLVQCVADGGHLANRVEEAVIVN